MTLKLKKNDFKVFFGGELSSKTGHGFHGLPEKVLSKWANNFEKCKICKKMLV